MKTSFLLLLMTLAAGQGPAQSNPASLPEKRLALVIGNGSYSTGSARPNALNDATDMAAMLTQLGFEVMVYKNTDKVAMQRAIDAFTTKLKNYQVGLFYYAGHGLQMGDQQFLVPVDAHITEAADIGKKCLLADQLIVAMTPAKAATNLVFLDTDWSNPFDSAAFQRNSGGYADTPPGFVVAYATTPGRSVVESNGRNSLYTAALLRALQTPNQTIIQLFQQVRLEVARQTNRKQVPWESTSLTGDFYFQRK